LLPSFPPPSPNPVKPHLPPHATALPPPMPNPNIVLSSPIHVGNHPSPPNVDLGLHRRAPTSLVVAPASSIPASMTPYTGSSRQELHYGVVAGAWIGGGQGHLPVELVTPLGGIGDGKRWQGWQPSLRLPACVFDFLSHYK
jgi:hypothetical protein